MRSETGPFDDNRFDKIKKKIETNDINVFELAIYCQDALKKNPEKVDELLKLAKITQLDTWRNVSVEDLLNPRLGRVSGSEQDDMIAVLKEFGVKHGTVITPEFLKAQLMQMLPSIHSSFIEEDSNQDQKEKLNARTSEQQFLLKVSKLLSYFRNIDPIWWSVNLDQLFGTSSIECSAEDYEGFSTKLSKLIRRRRMWKRLKSSTKVLKLPFLLWKTAVESTHVLSRHRETRVGRWSAEAVRDLVVLFALITNLTPQQREGFQFILEYVPQAVLSYLEQDEIRPEYAGKEQIVSHEAATLLYQEHLSNNMNSDFWLGRITQMSRLMSITYDPDRDGPDYDQFFTARFHELVEMATEIGVPFPYFFLVFNISAENMGNVDAYNRTEVPLSLSQALMSQAVRLSGNRFSDNIKLSVMSPPTGESPAKSVPLTRQVKLAWKIFLESNPSQVEIADFALSLSDQAHISVYEAVRLDNVTYTLLDIEADLIAQAILDYLQQISPEERDEFMSRYGQEVVDQAEATLAAKAAVDDEKTKLRDLSQRYLDEFGYDLIDRLFFGDQSDLWAWDAIGLGPNVQDDRLLVRYSLMWAQAGWEYYTQDLPEITASGVRAELFSTYQQDPKLAIDLLFADNIYDNSSFINFLIEQSSLLAQTSPLFEIQNQIANIEVQANAYRVNSGNFFRQTASSDADWYFQKAIILGYHYYLFNYFRSQLFNGEVNLTDEDWALLYCLAVLLREVSPVEMLASETNWPRLAGVDNPYNPEDILRLVQSLQDSRELFSLLNRDNLAQFGEAFNPPPLNPRP